MKIQEEYKNALREKQVIKKEILNFVIGQIKNKAIDLKRALTNDEVIKIIKKEIKGRKEAIVFLKKAGKTDDVIIENKKIEILAIYLPEMLSEESLKEIVVTYKEKLGIENLQKQRGQLIGAIMKEYGAVVDGSLLNIIISSLM